MSRSRRDGLLLWAVCLAFLVGVVVLVALWLGTPSGQLRDSGVRQGVPPAPEHGGQRGEPTGRTPGIVDSTDAAPPGGPSPPAAGSAAASEEDVLAEGDVADLLLSIRGRVFDARGEPVPDCMVVARREVVGRPVRTEATTAEDGRFELRRLVPAVYEIYAVQTGHAGVEPVTASAGQEDVVLVLGPGGGITGTVRWQGELPFCRVLVMSSSQRRGGALVDRGEDGEATYLVQALEPGEYDVQLWIDDLDLKLHRTVVVPGDEIVVCDFDDQDVRWVRGRLRGLPVGETVQFEAMRVLAGGLQPAGSVTPDPDGSFSFPLEGQGDYILRSPGRYPIPLHVGADGVSGTELEVPGGAISGRAVRADSARPEGVVLRLTLRTEGVRDSRSVTVFNESGEFSFTGLPAGTYDLFADAKDDARGSLDGLQLAADEVLRDVTITLGVGAGLTVDVREADGRAALATSVWCVDDHGFFFPVPAGEQPGRHRLEDMGIGGYALVAGSSLAGLAALPRIQVAPGPGSEVSVDLPGDARGSSVHLTAQTAAGDPIPRALVQVRTRAGQPFPDVTGDFVPTSAGNWTDDEGRFVSAPYPPGTYDLVVTTPDGATEALQFEVLGGGTAIELLVEF